MAWLPSRQPLTVCVMSTASASGPARVLFIGTCSMVERAVFASQADILLRPVTQAAPVAPVVGVQEHQLLPGQPDHGHGEHELGGASVEPEDSLSQNETAEEKEERNRRQLLEAIDSGNVETVEALLEAGVAAAAFFANEVGPSTLTALRSISQFSSHSFDLSSSHRFPLLSCASPPLLSHRRSSRQLPCTLPAPGATSKWSQRSPRSRTCPPATRRV